MRNCGTCRHWGDGTEKRGQQRTCARIDSEIHWDYDEGRYGRDAQAVMVVSECADSTLRTREDFGCTLHEPKEGESDGKQANKADA